MSGITEHVWNAIRSRAAHIIKYNESLAREFVTRLDKKNPSRGLLIECATSPMTGTGSA
jgi:hypothetical protein